MVRSVWVILLKTLFDLVDHHAIVVHLDRNVPGLIVIERLQGAEIVGFSTRRSRLGR